MRTGIIASGTYISAELQAEFGKIPPSFLPLGNRRLFEHQAEMLATFCHKIYISVPECFTIHDKDQLRLRELSLTTLPVNANASIGGSLMQTMEGVHDTLDDLVILYGDTLYHDLPEIPADTYCAHIAKDQYKWEPAPLGSTYQNAGITGTVISGGFAFSNTELLKEKLRENELNFIEALKAYNNDRPLMPLMDGDWHDFGHVQTFYRSVGAITTQRAFNDLEIRQQYVEKRSHDARKMDAEASWYENLPPDLRVFAPTYLGRVGVNSEFPGYRTENTFLSTLASLASFGEVNRDSWNTIFNHCNEFLIEARSYTGPATDANSVSHQENIDKGEKRLSEFCRTTGFDIDSELIFNGHQVPSLRRMLHETADRIPGYDGPKSLIHGDFCFSNIFFDFRKRNIKVIDPRGMTPPGDITIYGDPRYDLAKLAHSALGAYDAIIAGDLAASRSGLRFEMDLGPLRSSSWPIIRAAFHDAGFFRGIQRDVIDAMVVQLFLSMLPLHNDRPKRQDAFIANAARLFLDLNG